MATEDDEIYSDTPSSESVRDVRLIRKMFEVGPKSGSPSQGKSANATARGINGIGPQPPAKLHSVRGANGNNDSTPPTVPSKSAVPPKVKVPTASKVPPPPKNNQKSSVTSTNHLGTTWSSTNGVDSSVPHNGTSGDKKLQSVLRHKQPSATTTSTQQLSVKSDCTRISGLSGDRSTVYPPSGIPSESSRRNPSYGTTGYCVVSPRILHPVSPQSDKGPLNLVSGNKKTYRKLPVPTTRVPAPRKKPLPPGLPRNFVQKFMADMRLAKTEKVEAKISTERDSELLAYDDIYEDVTSYVN